MLCKYTVTVNILLQLQLLNGTMKIPPFTDLEPLPPVPSFSFDLEDCPVPDDLEISEPTAEVIVSNDIVLSTVEARSNHTEPELQVEV